MDRLSRVGIVSRAAVLALILGAGLAASTAQVVLAVLVVTLVAAASVYIALVNPAVKPWALGGEMLFSALVIGLGMPQSLALLPYLVVLSFLAGLLAGLPGAAVAVLLETISIAAVLGPFSQTESITASSQLLTPWFLTILGAALLGAWLKQIDLAPRPPADAAYESARRLLSELRTVTRRLSSGLDPVGMSADLLSVVHSELHDAQSAVFVRATGPVLSPLGYLGDGAAEVLRPQLPLIDECWADAEPKVGIFSSPRAPRVRTTVLPLRVGTRMIGVVVSASRPAPPVAPAPTPEALAELMRTIDERALRLETALVFDEIRSFVTTDERQRLAREIHDGIAQDVASLGYLVDDLVAGSSSEVQTTGLTDLRCELSRVVSELRLSIFDLRSEVTAHAGLGAALADYVHRVGLSSEMKVHVSLDEGASRLPSGVEQELLRIGQEAITNARRHSGAANLWVECRVSPPFARLRISDDGRGLDASGSDSYGMRIMAERASRIDGRVELQQRTAGAQNPGTQITVTLGEPASILRLTTHGASS